VSHILESMIPIHGKLRQQNVGSKVSICLSRKQVSLQQTVGQRGMKADVRH